MNNVNDVKLCNYVDPVRIMMNFYSNQNVMVMPENGYYSVPQSPYKMNGAMAGCMSMPHPFLDQFSSQW